MLIFGAIPPLNQPQNDKLRYIYSVSGRGGQGRYEAVSLAGSLFFRCGHGHRSDHTDEITCKWMDRLLFKGQQIAQSLGSENTKIGLENYDLHFAFASESV